MKHLVVGTMDFVIKTRGIGNKKGDDIDWVDNEQLTANGRYSPQSIEFFAPVHDEYGNVKGYTKVWLSPNDITALYEEINNLEGTVQVVKVDDDLPF